MAAFVVSLAGRHGGWLDFLLRFRAHYIVPAVPVAVVLWRGHYLDG